MVKDLSLLTNQQLVEYYLGGWHTLTPVLTRLSRRQLATLIEAELNGRRRGAILTRLHQRLTRMRAREEQLRLSQMAATTDVYKRGDLPTWLKEELKDER